MGGQCATTPASEVSESGDGDGAGATTPVPEETTSSGAGDGDQDEGNNGFLQNLMGTNAGFTGVVVATVASVSIVVIIATVAIALIYSNKKTRTPDDSLASNQKTALVK